MTSPNPREEGQAVDTADMAYMRQCFDRLHGLRLTIEKQNLPLPRTIIVEAQQAAGTLLADFASMRARAESQAEELRMVLADWNALVRAVGARKNGTAIAEAQQLRARAERAEEERDEAKRESRSIIESVREQERLARNPTCELMHEVMLRDLAIRDLTTRAEQAERERDEANRQRNEAREQIVWGRYTDREYRDRGSPSGWTWLPHVRMWARLDQDHWDAIQRAESAERELAEARKDAERYRWLRSHNTPHSAIYDTISDDCNPPYRGMRCGTDLDAAIDARLTPTPSTQEAT